MTHSLILSALSIEQQTELIPIASLSMVDSPRIAGESAEHVQLLAAAEGDLPPIIVHRSTMNVVDGRHRVAAAKERGDELIEACFFEGDQAEAFVLAVTSNIAHGLPLSLQERTAAALRIIKTHPNWSDRGIAKLAGISARTVADLRVRPCDPAAQTLSRRGRDGRARPVNGTEGRMVAAEIIARQPDLSLRQVARLAGISPETVRDVRRRLQQGESPVPDRGRRNKSGGQREENVKSQIAALSHLNTTAPATASRSSLVRQLESDPEFRGSARCNTLLRLLLAHSAEGESWRRLIDSIPAHHSDTIAKLALETSRIWQDLAERIRCDVPAATPAGGASVLGGRLQPIPSRETSLYQGSY